MGVIGGVVGEAGMLWIAVYGRCLGMRWDR